MDKLLLILTKKERILFTLLVLGMFLTMIFELLGISMVIPIVYSVTQDNIFEKYSFLSGIQQFLNFPDNRTTMFISLVFFLIIYFIKNVYLIFFFWWEGKLIYKIRENVSTRIFKSHLYKDYSFHINESSANLITRLKADIGIFEGAFMSLSILFSELIIFLGLSIFLLFIDFSGIFTISIFIAFFLIVFYYFFEKKIRIIGNIRDEVETYRSQRLLEGIRGIKEIKSFGMENFFSSKYSQLSSKLSKVSHLFHVIQRAPRLYLETIALAGIVIFSYFLINSDADLQTIFATLGLVFAAAIRLLPSANRLLNSFHVIKFGAPSIKSIYNEIKNTKIVSTYKEDDLKIEFNEKIKLANISFKYPNRENFIFKDINLEILKGEKVAITGDSGCGKSTLLDIIMGFHFSTSGKIMADEQEIPLNSKAWRKLIGYVPQSIYLFDDSILENIGLGVLDKNLDKDYLKKCIEISELSNLVNSLPEKMDSLIGEEGAKISGGQKQRIGIARALFKKPSILILDEATNALDSHTEIKLIDNLIHELKNMTIIMVTHKKNLVKNFDKILKVEGSKVKII